MKELNIDIPVTRGFVGPTQDFYENRKAKTYTACDALFLFPNDDIQLHTEISLK